MTPSINCFNLIRRFEQCRLTAYLPTPNDVPTIGWGTTGPDIHLGLVWTQTQADARFQQDVTRFAASVSALVSPKTTQNQFDALVSFAYNEGAQALHSSTLLKDHNAGNYAAADHEFARWNTQKHVVLNGLVTRRAAEAALYLTP